ncbi:MAG TPA: hypothetical protein VFZ28_05935, partial [Burkholderiaceae bacterium]|nr:hypothetical protein [Burkholderiaceae bacterium]
LREQAHKLAAAVAGFRLDGAAAAFAPASTIHDLSPGRGTLPAASAMHGESAYQPWDGTERRGPGRATNVTRLPATTAAPAASAATGTDDEWESF